MFGIPTQRLAKVTVTETTSVVTLSVNPIVIAALSFTPRHLLVRTNVLATTGTPNFRIRFNGDTASNYNIQVLDAAGSSATTLRETADHFGLPTNVTSDANEFCSGSFLFPDALSTRSHKSVLAMSGRVEDFLRVGAGRWANTAAITSVTLYLDSSTFTAGSTFELCVVDESFNIDQDGDGEQILGSDGTFSVGSISAADGDLVVIGNLRTDRGTDADTMKLHFNSDTTSGNYYRQRLYGSGTSTGATSDNNDIFGITMGDTATANAFGATCIQIQNFSDGSNDRSSLSLTGDHADSGKSDVFLDSRRWNNTAAITAFSLLPGVGTNFHSSSMLSTYAVPKNLIERQELSGNATTVTFADIPQTYDHLELSIQGRAVGTAVGTRAIAIEVNADSTDGNYAHQVVYGQSTTVAASQYANENLTIIPAQTATANIFGVFVSTFYNYTKTDRHKHYLTVGGIDTSIELISSRWENTAAISSFVVKCNADDYLAGSVFTLRGIHSTAPAAASDVAALNSIAPADIAAVN
tara:strand:+ start:65 stop:1639 length:1575 start_codon:yes stop_codon:yes gene_type:complete